MAPYFTAPIATVRRDDLVGQAAGCQYATAAGRSSINVVVVTGSQAQAFFNASKTDNGVAGAAMSAIGDNAVRSAHDVWVSAIKANVFCGISGQHGAVAAKGTGELAGLKDYDTNDDVPDAVAAPVAARLGATCSKLFSTGP